MAQFMVYQNKNPHTQNTYPYFVDIQSNLLKELRTTVVIPLCHLAPYNKKPMTTICPIVMFNGNQYVALTQQLAGVDRKILGTEIASISEYRDDLIAAIDFIVSGV